MLVFHVPISGRRGLKVRGRHGSWALLDRPLEWSELSDGVPDRQRLCVGLSAMRKIGARAWFLACACPPALEVVMITFKVSPPLGVFFATTFLQEIYYFHRPFAHRRLLLPCLCPYWPCQAELGPFSPRN
jgi:hypothetical protein